MHQSSRLPKRSLQSLEARWKRRTGGYFLYISMVSTQTGASGSALIQGLRAVWYTEALGIDNSPICRMGSGATRPSSTETLPKVSSTMGWRRLNALEDLARNTAEITRSSCIRHHIQRHIYIESARHPFCCTPIIIEL
jgi:hypothetical protein